MTVNSQSAPFASTANNWIYATIGIPAGASSISLAIANASSEDVWIDSILIAPLAGSFLARTYDPVTQSLTSAQDSGGRTRWTYYDSFERPTLQIGPNGQVKELAQRFLSAQNGAFNPASPNAEVTLHPADGGSMETFLDGSAWQANWAPSNPSNWQAANGALTHSGASSDSLTCQSPLPATFAVYFEIAPGASPNLTLTAGNVSVAWTGSSYSGSAAGASLAALASPPSIALYWLLVVGDGIILFFADGQLIFSQTGSFSFAAPVVSTSAPLSITHLSLLATPRLGISYNDGASRQRQVQQLYSADARVSQIIYDPLDRVVATTRVAPGSFGSGASQPAFQYRPGFVDVDAFLSTLATTGVMTGDIASYYAGQMENGVPRSNDEGYPYTTLGAVAAPPPVGVGQTRQTLRNRQSLHHHPRDARHHAVRYGSNNGALSQLPAGDYSQTTITTPIKATSLRISDKLGQSVAALQQAGAQNTAESLGIRSYANAQTTLDVQLPNALLSGPQSNDANFVRSTEADAAGRAISASDPNTGATQFLYDPCGRVRFVQPAMNAGEQWFLYNKYDVIGRLTEQGTIPQPWNVETLAPLAANASWPDTSVSRTITLAWTYDGDGSNPADIGQKISCVTTGPNSVATENFNYDSSGRLISVALSITGAATAQGTTGYTYNNLGELTSLTMPSGTPLAAAYYSLNDQGWITGIGPAAGSSTIAAYTYTIDGSVEIETLGAGAWTRSTQYLSPGWVAQVTAASAAGSQSHTLAYNYNADSTIASRQVTYKFAALSASLSDTYSYDGQGRLTSATGSSNDQITSYDPNGNIWAITLAGAAQNLPASAGTDQLSQSTLGGQSSPAIYDACGRMTGSLNRTFLYDNTTNLTTSASSGSAQVQFGYGGHGQRVLKTSGSGTSVYFTGSSKLPVARMDNSQWSALVYGPTGLVAVYSDQAYFPIKDSEQSVRAVVDANGLVAQFTYLPFGQTAAAGANPLVLAYRFMGQEWDEELALYNFVARMYDPVLRRFLSPDPARQFPSPYVFCGNNPLTASDPTGDISLWAQIGIGIGMAAVLVAGVALSLVTFGAAAPAAAGAEVGLAGAEAGAVAGAEVAGAAAGAAGEGAGAAGAAAAEGGAAAAAEVGAGAAAEGGGAAGAGAGAAGTSSALTTAANFGIQVAAGAIESAGTSGIQYDIQNGRDFTAGGFFEAVGWGAASGAIGAGLAAVPGLSIFAEQIGQFSALAKFGIAVAVNGVAGAESAAVTQVLANLADHKPWYEGLLESTAIGLGTGAALGGISEGIKGRAAIGDDLRARIGDDNIQSVSSMIDKVQQAARTSNAYAVYGTAAFFITAGFAVWGADEIYGSH